MIWGVAVLFFTGSADSMAKELAVISNKSYPADRLTLAVLKDIYSGEKTMEGSVRIIPVDQEDLRVREKFVEEVLGHTVNKYDAYWFTKAFKDGVVPPVARENSREVIFFIEREIGAIGYVWESEVQGKAGIKVLLRIEVGEP